MDIPKNIQELIKEVNEVSCEIPFGNSEFQNQNFVLNAEITPARKLRHCLLRLNNRIKALRECYYDIELENIDIEEMEYKLPTIEDAFEKRRTIIKIERKKSSRENNEMLIKDCIIEIYSLYEMFKSLPKYSREEFEAEEYTHYQLKLASDLQLQMQFGQGKGIAESLANMNVNSDWLMNMLSVDGALKKEVEEARNSKTKLIKG